MKAADKLGGLHRRVMANSDHIDPQHWTGLVGSCRHCPGGYLMAVEDGGDRHGGVTYYTATCNTCRHEVVCPGGRTLAHSSRQTEAPYGFWASRDSRLKGEGH